MSDTDPDMVDPDTPPAEPEPGPHREMVALSITKGPRDIARYVKTRPEYSGNPEDWVCFAYLLASFFEQVKLQATATGNDARKTSDVEEHVEAWEDDNKFVFELLMSMISTKTTAGKTLIKQVIKKFPIEGEKQGDELFKFMEEKATGLTKMQIKQLKEDIKKVELLESDSPKTLGNQADRPGYAVDNHSRASSRGRRGDALRHHAGQSLRGVGALRDDRDGHGKLRQRVPGKQRHSDEQVG